MATTEGKRQASLRERVRLLMEDGRWRSLREISGATGGSEAGVSARLRDLRKQPHNRTVSRKRSSGNSNLWLYRLEPAGQLELWS